MPKIRKIREIPSKVKNVETIDTQEYPENLEEGIEEAELEEFAEFVTGIPSSETGLEPVSPVLESGQTLEEVSDLEETEAETLPTEFGGGPVYESEGGLVYESGKVYASAPSTEETPTYALPSSPHPESDETPSATLAGSTGSGREIAASRQQIGGLGSPTGLEREREPDRRYELREEAEGIRIKDEDRHRRG